MELNKVEHVFVFFFHEKCGKRFNNRLGAALTTVKKNACMLLVSIQRKCIGLRAIYRNIYNTLAIACFTKVKLTLNY